MNSGNVVFSSEEYDKNERRKQNLIRLISGGESILMVGAGSSVDLGYTQWSTLMEELENLALDIGQGFHPQHRDDNLKFAEEIKHHIASHDTNGLDKYFHKLYIMFRDDNKDPQHLPWHRALVGLPFRGIITTNYDKVLEHALDRQLLTTIDYSLMLDRSTDASKFVSSLLKRSQQVSQIAHLHGIFSEPEKIVLSHDDYASAYGGVMTDEKLVEPRWTLRRKLLWAILATRRLIFVGFSLTDPYLNMMLNLVADDLWQWGEPVHYAVMSISKETKTESLMRANMLKRRFGIEVVFYEIKNNSHVELANLVMSIAHVCRSIRNDDPVPAEVELKNRDLSQDHQEAPTLHSSPLVEVSKKMKRRKERNDY